MADTIAATELYQCSKSNISEHIKHIFEEGELDKDQLFGNSEQLQMMEKHIMLLITI